MKINYSSAQNLGVNQPQFGTQAFDKEGSQLLEKVDKLQNLNEAKQNFKNETLSLMLGHYSKWGMQAGLNLIIKFPEFVNFSENTALTIARLLIKGKNEPADLPNWKLDGATREVAENALKALAGVNALSYQNITRILSSFTQFDGLVSQMNTEIKPTLLNR